MSGSAEIDADLILQHSGFIRSLARGLLRDESLVDDVVQDTLIKALEKGPRRREALTAWLRTVTRNVVYKSYRGSARRRSREQEVAKPERLDATADRVARSEALESLTAAVVELPESGREVIFLRYYEGLSHAEIAERLGIEPGAVRMRVHRAQKQLQERLDRSSGGDRLVWMSGLAGLLGIPLSDLEPSAAAETATAPIAGSTLLIWTVAFCAGFGALVWLGIGPKARPTEFTESVGRSVDLDASPAEDALAATVAEPEREPGVHTASTGAGTNAALGAAEAPEPTFPPGNLVGTVVDAAGIPVPRARISAAWGRFPMGVRARADDDGRFGLAVPEEDLRDAKAGIYSILVGATAEGSSPSPVIAFPFEGLDPASDGQRLLLRMRGPGAALDGVVLGPDGRPRAGATVEIGDRRRLGVGFLGQQYAEARNPLAPHLATSASRTGGSMFQGHRSMRGTLGGQVIDGSGRRARLLPASTQRTSSEGAFHFGGLEPCRHRMRITAPGCAPWTGFVEVTAGGTESRVFRLAPGATLRGRVRRSDGLPTEETLVHAIVDDPYTVSTVRIDAEGEFAIGGLPAGRVRLVAEERIARTGVTPTRIASASVTLSAGETLVQDLEIHPPAAAPVRVFALDEGVRRPLADMTIEVRARHNPLLLIASTKTDVDGLALVPLETVVPCDWALTQSIVRRKSRTGEGLAVETPIRFLDAPATRPTEEIVVTLSEDDLRPATVLMRPVVPGSGPLGLKDGLQLFRERSACTFTGWPTEEPGVLAFHGVPPGEYRVLYPHHGLGWISPFTLTVSSGGPSATVDFGSIELPRLGTLELRPSTDDPGAPRWHDLSIQAVIDDGDQPHLISVFCGRVETPTRIQVAPGRYRLSRDARDPGRWEELVVLADEVAARLWP